MIRTAAFPLFALMLAGAAPPEQPQRAVLPVHIGGRVVPAPGGSLSFGWPGVYIEGRFKGTSVRVRFDAPDDFIRLSIDGTERKVFRAPGAVDTMIDGLSPGEHVVRLEKLTETQVGASRFIAFEVAGKPLVARPRSRAIEFIGDSFTVGYGNSSATTQCTGAEVHDRTDTSQAFGPLAAKALDADYRINAFSGFGIVRNYAGRVAGESLPFLYPRAIPGIASPAADDTDWRPQTIVINLGGNDFSTPLNPGERWADTAALESAYRERYTAFVTDLAARQPQARFILAGTDLFFPQVEQVAAGLSAKLPGRVSTLRITGLDLRGCHGHPSLADHRLIADLLIGAIGRR
jgi:lysophospholipase L1-like esterase